MDAQRHLARLRPRLAALRPLAVAFSGGVDSSCLLAVARDVLGDDVVAVTGVSPSLSRHQRVQAERVAESLGARHVLLPTGELGDERYASNPRNRCFFCKDELYGRLAGALGCGWPHVADGTNVDDLGDFRPGREAARRHGVVSPFVDAGLDKAAVRAVSRHLGLETAELPASPCLASRLPYGRRVTPEALAQIERGEEALRRLGFRDFRVRHFGAEARVEIAEEERGRLRDAELRRRVVAGVLGAGFDAVAIDERPLRSGRLNETEGRG